MTALETIIDTHLHLVDRSRLHYPWLSHAPTLNRDWRYSAYATAAHRLGIIGALHMEVDVAPADRDRETEMVAELMAEPESLILGAIASAPLGEPSFDAWLEGLDRATVKGLRRVLHVVPDEVSQDPNLRADIARLGAAGLPFDLCMTAKQQPLALALIDACPQTLFVLDHCGVPDIAGGDYTNWSRGISELAKRPNLVAKISGISAYTDGDWHLSSLMPWIEHVVRSFGWERVVWGSDSPVCNLHSTLDQWVAVTRAAFAGCSSDERAALYRHNACRIWQLKEPKTE